MRIMHYINAAVPDGARTTAICGARLTADVPGTADAKASGEWVMCPLCELRRTLADMGLETDPCGEPPNGKWSQGTLFD